MVRARHQTFLAQQQQNQSPFGLLRWKSKHLVCGTTIGDPLATAGCKPSVGTGEVASVEPCEENNTNQEFAQVVVSVVGVSEEGVFRDIVSYL